VERNDFISGDAYYRYKFERESKNEEIQRLRTKMERMRTDNYVRVAYDIYSLPLGGQRLRNNS